LTIESEAIQRHGFVINLQGERPHDGRIRVTLPRYVGANGVRMTKISPIDFKPELVAMMKSVLEQASAHIDTASGKPATPATKAKMASRILATAAEGVTDAGTLHSVAIEEGLCPAD
jgi:hypothetical protein